MARHRRRRQRKKHHGIRNERHLCEIFAGEAKDRGWKVFPETSGCDLLLVATEKTTTQYAKPGDQIGVQAKMLPNISVLNQASPNRYRRGPDYHAVLVPSTNDDFDSIATSLRIMVFDVVHWDYFGEPHRHRSLACVQPYSKQYYDEPLWYPELELETPAGVRSPKSITPWKVKAVRLCLYAEEHRGFLTSADFREHQVSMTVWKQKGWITKTEEKTGRAFRYKINEDATPPHMLYPNIAERMREDRKKK